MRTVTSLGLSLPLLILHANAGERSSLEATAMFRGGPPHSGVYVGGGPTLLGLAWRAPTQGDVISSPTIAGGVVYIGSGDGRLYALDLATGDRKWMYDAGSAVSSSPAVGGGLVFAAARDGSIFAVDAATGARRWRLTTGPDLPLPWGHESGDHFISSPVYVDGTVIVGAGDGGVYALDAATGHRKWRAETEGRVRSSPAVAGALVYFGDAAGRIHAVDRATGDERWMFRTGASVFSSPAVAGDLVVVGSTDGGVYALRSGNQPAIRRAVFFDSSYRKAATVRDPEATSQYLAHRGYQLLNADGLTRFLSDRIADRAPSVVVFAIDRAPASVTTAPLASSILRRYLNAGGKIVWTGKPPLIFDIDLEKGSYPSMSAMNWRAPNELLGIAYDAAIFDVRGAAATEPGLRIGLPARWRDSWSVAPAGVTTVLGRDEWGLAAAWIRSYGGAPGTGFVRVPGDDPLVVYLAAESTRP